MKSNIFIPKIINVGYQNRSDTYTGKLAYVIYTDNKGVLRKEASWNSWRDKNIEPNEFENVPTSGFVLNKKAGDYSDGWNHRQAYCRVYDPRNFEFEITIENLLYILENANSIKGKGLEGEFVYGWDGKDLVLMPVDAPDYKEISEYNKIVHNNESIRARDLILGATYMTKNNKEMIYMGKHNYYSYGYKWEENGECKTSKNMSDIPTQMVNNHYGSPLVKYIPYERIVNYSYGKYFWFAYKEYDYDWIGCNRIYKDTFKWQFEIKKSLPANMFISCTNDKCTQEYADIYEAMESRNAFCPHDPSKDVVCDMSLEDFLSLGIKKYSNGEIYYTNFKFISSYENGDSNKSYLADKCYGSNTGKYQIKLYTGSEVGWYGYSVGYDKNILEPMCLQDIYEIMQPKYIQQYLENGREYKKEYELQ